MPAHLGLGTRRRSREESTSNRRALEISRERPRFRIIPHNLVRWVPPLIILRRPFGVLLHQRAPRRLCDVRSRRGNPSRPIWALRPHVIASRPLTRIQHHHFHPTRPAVRAWAPQRQAVPCGRQCPGNRPFSAALSGHCSISQESRLSVKPHRSTVCKCMSFPLPG